VISTDDDILREAIVREAKSWLLTPFHDCAGVKGAGVDCAHLILRVFAAVGKTPDVPIKAYRPQWFLHRKEPLFLQELKERGAHQIDLASALPGDVLMYDFGIHAAHGAIVIDANTIIHAYKPAKCVCLGSRREFADKFDSAWSLFP
jgi:cell wall-associated NlpC family hydrolase